MDTTAKVLVAAVAVALVVAGIVTISLAARRGNASSIGKAVIVNFVGTAVAFRADVREPIAMMANPGESRIASLTAPKGYRVHTVQLNDKTYEFHSPKLMHPSRVVTKTGDDFEIHDVEQKYELEWVLLKRL
jgi:hypothetical protein